ncbi:hypothetical protein ACTMU2_05210 [Cupriavidus basilensis]
MQQLGDRIYLPVDGATFQQPAEFTRIGIAAAGDTWEEVERDLDMPPGTLSTTVSNYNRHAAEGADPLFHKAAKWLKPLDEPPFVALDCRIDYAFYPHFTLGGLDTLPTGQVLSERARTDSRSLCCRADIVRVATLGRRVQFRHVAGGCHILWPASRAARCRLGVSYAPKARGRQHAWRVSRGQLAVSHAALS